MSPLAILILSASRLFIRCFRDVQLLQKLLHLQLLQPARLPFSSHILGWKQRWPLSGGTSWQVHNCRRKMPSMLSLMLGLDLLRPLWRQQSKLTRIVLLGSISMSLPEISIGFPGANPTPFSENANTPIVEQLFVILFWRYLSCHRYSSFYFYAGQVGKKVCSSFRLSTIHHPLFMLSVILTFPFRFPFLLWCCLDSVVLGVCWFKKWRSMGLHIFLESSFFWGIIVDIFAE